MRKFTKKEKILVGVASVAVMAAVVSQIPMPSIKGTAILDRQIQIKKRMIADILDILERKEQIQQEIVTYGQYVRPERTEDEETVDFIAEIEDIAKISAVELIDVKPSSPQEVNRFVEYRLEIETEGPIQAISMFLYSIQKSEALLRVVKLRLSPKSDGVNILKCYLTVTKIFTF